MKYGVSMQNTATGMGRYDMREFNNGTSYMHDGRVRFPVSIHVHIGSSADATPVLSIARSSPGCQQLEQTQTYRLRLVSRLADQQA
jgi:hypothetical protein